jgi:hypothetical protein
MLSLILVSCLFYIDQVDCYYFTSASCIPCKKQTPIILKLKEEGYDFEFSTETEKFKIKVFPTIIFELVDYKNRKVKRVRLEGLQSYQKLKKLLQRFKE